jgi:hypothetical protein
MQGFYLKGSGFGHLLRAPSRVHNWLVGNCTPTEAFEEKSIIPATYHRGTERKCERNSAANTEGKPSDFNAGPTSTTFYIPSTSGMLTIITYPTNGNVNVAVCNNTERTL